MGPRHPSVVFLALLLAGAAAAVPPPQIVVGIKPVHSLVAGLMRGVADPTLLSDDAAPPWEHRLTPSQTTALQAADLIVWTGPELEPALGAWLAAASRPPRTLELLAADALKILPARGAPERRDPFFWTDSRNMLILLDHLAELLISLDPERGHRYRQNHLALQAEIAQLDRELEYGYRDVSATPVFLFHDTQQYFEQAYAMKVAGIAASPPQAPVSGLGLLTFKEGLGQARAPCLFTEAGLPTPHLTLVLAGMGDTRVVALDTLGARLTAGPGLYPALMRGNYQAIKGCVKPAGDTDGAVPDAAPRRIQTKYLLMNQYGDTVSNLDFLGRYQVIYFGYTYCPDICPTALVTLSKALELLGPDAERIQPLFITVDPERDTPEKMRGYVGYFHPRLLGLTGPPAMIERVADNFRVRYERVEAKDADPGRYAMDHSASLFVVGPDGEFVTKFAHGFPADRMAERLRELMNPP